MKRFDLMMGINTRGTFMVSKYCIPHLKKAENPHILMLSPPLDMKTEMVRALHRLHHGEVRHEHVRARPVGRTEAAGVAVNALWPRTTIATAAVGNLLGGDAMMRASRKPDIMGDAAYVIFTKPSRNLPGSSASTTSALRKRRARLRALPRRSAVPLMSDFFVPDDDVPPPGVTVMALSSVGGAQKSR